MEHLEVAIDPEADPAPPANGRRLARAAVTAVTLAALAACTTSTPRPSPAGGGIAGGGGAGSAANGGSAVPGRVGEARPGAGQPAAGIGGGASTVGPQAGAVPLPVTGGGAYYLDDGPGHHPMPSIETLVDAVPRAEPLHPRANRPYQVFGRDYVPLTERAEFREQGVASWYGRKFHGRPTSTGEPYDMYGMTAAHPTLPLPSYARVTSLENGRSVVVRVNDRGPFLRGRVIDLSAAAAHRLGYMAAGSARVEVELIGTAATTEGQTALALLDPNSPPPAVASGPGAPVSSREGGGLPRFQLPVVQVSARSATPPVALVTAVSLSAAPELLAGASASTPASATTASTPSAAGNASTAAAAAAGAPAPTATAESPPPTAPDGHFVQLAAFRSRAAADDARQRFQGELVGVDAPLRIVEGVDVYRVQAGPYGDRRLAGEAAARIRRATGLRPWIVGQP